MQDGPFHTMRPGVAVKRWWLILEKNAELDAKPEYRSTPLHLTAVSGLEAEVRLLLEMNAEMNARTESQATPLHLAEKSGSEAVVRLLLEKNAEINARTQR